MACQSRFRSLAGYEPHYAEKRCVELGLELPVLPKQVGNFVTTTRVGSLLFVSGQGPLLADSKMATGKVGLDVTVQQAYEHARRVGLVLLAALREQLGSLDRVSQVVKLLGLVNATPDFAEHPTVINGCSDLMVEVFGERGRHARTSFGVGSLPGQITVEVEMVVEVHASRKSR